ncbi:serine/threonine-protein kinase N2-like [Amia ocellicauda]|uniref:serine/threonine-protein kinase N2-like n=1 Tax=Amia ocellicauda TaxID=2972642 RepID=UPI003463AB9C
MFFQGRILPLVFPAALVLMGWYWYKSRKNKPDPSTDTEECAGEQLQKTHSPAAEEEFEYLEENEHREVEFERLQKEENEHLEMQEFEQLEKEIEDLEEFEDLEKCLEDGLDLDLPQPDVTGQFYCCLEDFKCVAVLGRGAFGKVLLAESRRTTQRFALKAIQKRGAVDSQDVASLMCERSVLQTVSSVHHPFLVNFYGSFQTEEHLVFIMEYVAGGDLTLDGEAISEPRAVFSAACVVLGVDFLHRHNIAHRDLKLPNLLMDRRGFVKIADFGLCKENMGVSDRTSSFCGTPDFLAPEVLSEESYTRAVDWWALGVLLFEMMVGDCPFTGANERDLYESIVNDPVPFPQHLSNEAVSVMTRLMSKNPAWRLGAGERGAQDVMQHAFFRSVDWPGLEAQRVTPPFVPTVREHKDVGDDLTSEAPVLSLGSRVLSPEEQDLFQEFDFVADRY